MISSDSRLDLRALRFASLGWAALALLGLSAGIETVSRSSLVTGRLPPPSIGSPVRTLDHRLEEWNRFLDAGPADVLFLGDSTLGAAVNVPRFESTVERLTGFRPRAFLMRVAGLDVETAAVLVQALATRDSAAVLVYGFTGGKLSSEATATGMRELRQTPWLRQRLGDVSLEGWLTNHSRSYGYYLLYRQWLRPGTWKHVVKTDTGLHGEWVAAPSRPPRLEAEHVSLKYGPLRVSPAATSALARLVAEQGAGRTVLVEVPARADGIEALGRGSYERAVSIAAGIASRSGGVLFRAPTSRIAPSDVDWRDMRHVKPDASLRFSDWFAERLVAAARAGVVALPGVAGEP